jgi:hypothetical protein
VAAESSSFFSCLLALKLIGDEYRMVNAKGCIA